MTDSSTSAAPQLRDATLIQPRDYPLFSSEFRAVIRWAEATIAACFKLLNATDITVARRVRQQASDLGFAAGHTMLGDAESAFIYDYKQRATVILAAAHGIDAADDQIDERMEYVSTAVRAARRAILEVHETLKSEFDAHISWTRTVSSFALWWYTRVDSQIPEDYLDKLHKYQAAPSEIISNTLVRTTEQDLLRLVENALDKVIAKTTATLDDMTALRKAIDGIPLPDVPVGHPAWPTAAQETAEGVRPGTIRTGLGRNLDQLATHSPSLIRLLRELREAGWTIGYSTTPGGRVDTDNHRITIDTRAGRSPQLALEQLIWQASRAQSLANFDQLPPGADTPYQRRQSLITMNSHHLVTTARVYRELSESPLGRRVLDRYVASLPTTYRPLAEQLLSTSDEFGPLRALSRITATNHPVPTLPARWNDRAAQLPAS